CWSYVGRSGSKQAVSLRKRGCLRRGSIHHEINHALGIEHEHIREDRDQYVTVMYENIKKATYDSFKPRKSDTFGLAYDYLSVMHYGRRWFDFSIARGKPSIVPIPNADQKLGQRSGNTNLDYAKLNALYEC
uniref:Metalloendopeptidase n=1 Tax=Latimeria chalumnae TaxID=7897 RepID=H2ZRW3_LATCH